jgi:cytochrome c
MRSIGILAIAALGIVQPAAGQDAALGQKVFKQQCNICHDVAPGRIRVGPSLFGVVGRKAGTMDGYHYSDANRSSGITWDQPNLDKYLMDPRSLVPGTKMTFAGVKNDEERQSLIAYLATLH